MYFARSNPHTSHVSSSAQHGPRSFDLEALDLACSAQPQRSVGLLIQDILRSPLVVPKLPGLLKDNMKGVSSTVCGVIRKYLGDFFKKTDVVSAVSLYQNRDYLDMEHQAINQRKVREQIQSFVNSIETMPGISEAKKAELKRLSLNVLSNIGRLSPGGGRWFKKSLFALSSVGLCILPLLTAHKNKDYQYFSLLVAGYVKTMFMLLGLLRNSTSDLNSFLLHFKERHIPYFVPSIPYVFTAYNHHARQFEAQHVWPFVALSSVFTGTIFLASSAPQLFSKPVVRIFNQAKRLALGEKSQAAQQPLSEDISTLVHALFQSVRKEMNEFVQRKRDFESQGQAISDVVSTQTIDIQKSYQQLEKSVCDLLDEQAATDASSSNPDFKQKLIFTLLAASLCVGSAATYYDEPMGLVDLGTDSALTVGEMLKTTFSTVETTQRAAEKFSSYSGLAPFLLPFGILNKIPATHFTDSIAGLATGIVLLTGANLLLPRATSEALSSALLRRFKSEA